MNFSVFSLFLPENQDSLPEERERPIRDQNLWLEIEQEVDLCLAVFAHITCSTSTHIFTYAVIIKLSEEQNKRCQ